ncbi:MAG: O-antigen ligase family protein [Erysipelotrichaceae bacterium]|nr:O-antigen ligase family protein [Erysipelotrichaceae bacterium]
MKKQKEYSILFYGTILLCLWGGIYDFAIAFYGMTFACILLCIIWKNPIKIPQTVSTIGMLAISVGYGISIVAAKDQGIAFLGLLRILAMFIFYILWNNIEMNVQKRVWEILPVLAVLVTVIAIVAYPFSELRDVFFRAGRLGGVFQYSNTYALFLLIAVVILLFRETKKRSDYIMLAVLIAGIVICGSRSVMVLALIVISLWIYKDQKLRRPMGFVLGVVAIWGVGIQLIARMDLQRLFKLTLHSSTLNGRFLYWKDAASVILKNPLGLGYMGYYFLQPQFQTGNYMTKFVHNDILQCGLDAGIIPMAMLVYMIAANIIDKTISTRNRVILAIIMLHCLFDLDLQFGAMMCLMIMCLNGNNKKIWKCKAAWNHVLIGMSTIILAYFTVALGLAYFGMNEEALVMYPGNTFAREQLMESDAKVAEEIIEQNGMIASAYSCAVKIHIEKQEYEEAYKDIEGMIKCAGYNIDYYNLAVYDLSFCLQQAIDNNDEKMMIKCIDKIKAVPKTLEEIEQRTSKLAFKINDKPELELAEEIQEYVKSISGIDESSFK